MILPVGSTPHSEDQHLFTAYLLYGEALYWVQRDAEVCRTILLSSGLCIVQRWKYYSDLKNVFSAVIGRMFYIHLSGL